MRSDPWSEWREYWRAGRMISETLSAAGTVMEKRQETIEQAIRDPLGADYAELGRMVSEKAVAFGAAGVSLSHDWWAMQREWSAQAADVSAMLLGHVPGPGKVMAMTARGQRLGSAALASSMRAMRPIHRAATANRKRLTRGKR